MITGWKRLSPEQHKHLALENITSKRGFQRHIDICPYLPGDPRWPLCLICRQIAIALNMTRTTEGEYLP